MPAGAGAGAGGIVAFASRSLNESYPYSGTIKLRSCKLTALGSIAGEVRLTVIHASAELKGLWVQMITIASAWPTGKEKRLGFKESELKLRPPYVVVFGATTEGEDESEGRAGRLKLPTQTLTQDIHRFPFIFKLNDHHVPASFKSSYGQIQQRFLLIAVANNGALQVLDERPIVSTGCLNISKVIPDLSQPVEVIQRKTKSMFSSAIRLQLTMELQRKGYLPAERIVGRILIENPTGEEMELMKIDCIQRIIYFDSGLHKRMTAVLDTNSLDCSDGHNVEALMVKDFQLQLPPLLMPAWESPDRAFRLSYFVQCVIKTVSGLEMKAESEVIIGTHDGKENTRSRRSSIMTFPPLEHRNSDSQIEFLRRSMESLPPSYSALSSRRSSVSTLPPNYNAAVKE